MSAKKNTARDWIDAAYREAHATPASKPDRIVGEVPEEPVENVGATEGDEEMNLFDLSQAQLDKAMKLVDLHPMVAAILSQPKNELIIHFPATGCNTTTSLAHSRAACATTRGSTSMNARRWRRG
jgi:hypothetical protein